MLTEISPSITESGRVENGESVAISDIAIDGAICQPYVGSLEKGEADAIERTFTPKQPPTAAGETAPHPQDWDVIRERASVEIAALGTRAILSEALDLCEYLRQAFQGRFPTHPKPSAEWWGGLHMRLDGLQPQLVEAVGEQA